MPLERPAYVEVTDSRLIKPLLPASGLSYTPNYALPT